MSRQFEPAPLNKAQRVVLMWLVAEIRAGRLTEEVRVVWWRGDGQEKPGFVDASSGFVTPQPPPPELSSALLESLAHSGWLTGPMRSGDLTTYIVTAYALAEVESRTQPNDIADTQAMLRWNRILEAALSLDDLRTVCFHMDIEYDNLAGETKRVRLHELLLRLRRERRLPELEVVVQRDYPYAFKAYHEEQG